MYTKEQFKEIFKEKFNVTIWKNTFLKSFFGAAEIRIEEPGEPIEPSSETEFGYYLGKLQAKDAFIGFFYYQINEGSVAHRRVGLRNLVKQFINRRWGIFDAALVVFDDGENWRLSLVCDITEEATAAKRFTFVFGDETQQYHTAVQRFMKLQSDGISFKTLKEAFSVEMLTKEFFDKYKESYQDIVEFFTGERIVKKDGKLKTIKIKEPHKSLIWFFGGTQENHKKYARDFCKKMLGRIVFLYFIQKKGWLGATTTEYKDGNLTFVKDFITIAKKEQKCVYSELCVLFFEVLNTKRGINNSKTEDDFKMPNNEIVKIPFLNGGLFEKEYKNGKDESLLPVPDEFLEDFIKFLDEYNFTIDENEPNDHTVAVDPEMLGHIFENLLEDNKEKGAFYTPKEIVYYMCQESLIEYLTTWFENKGLKIREIIGKLLKKQFNDDDTDLIKKQSKELHIALDNIKICDPAIGSGAFPMGLLQEIFSAKQILHLFEYGSLENFRPSIEKLNIIQNNIYGVDNEKGAVDIARLRFWLSLIIDEQFPKPLPNLDYKIVEGNSLLSMFEDEVVMIDWEKKGSVGEADTHIRNLQTSMEKLTQKQQQFFKTSNHIEKDKLKNEIRLLKIEILVSQITYNKLFYANRNVKTYNLHSLTPKEHKRNCEIDLTIAGFNNKIQKLQNLKNQPEKQLKFFDWKLDFPEVMNSTISNKTGFDIVIGNPPYGAKLTKEEKDLFKVLFDDVHMRTPDTFNYFISKSISPLLKEKGVISYIVPNNLLFQGENTKTRNFLINTNHLLRVINLGDNTFENADVPTCIFIALKEKKENYDIAYSDERKELLKTIDFNHIKKYLPKNDINKIPDLVIGISSVGVRILKDIEMVSWKIDDVALEVASGISTGGDKIFRIPKQFAIENNFEQEILKPVLVGGEIDKYKNINTEHLIIYTDRETKIEKISNIKEYLSNYRQKLEMRSEARAGIMPWFSLNRQRYKNLFEEKKIIIRQTSDSIRATFDKNGFYTLDSILVFKIKPKISISYRYALVLLNSKLNNYVYKNITQEEGRTFAQVKPQNVRKLFLPKISVEEQKVFETLCDYLFFLNDESNQPVNMRISNVALAQFFQEIADACVVELIYGKDMQQSDVDILKYVRKEIKPIEHLEYETQRAREIFNVHYAWSQPENEIRNRMKIISLMCPDTAGKILSGYEKD